MIAGRGGSQHSIPPPPAHTPVNLSNSPSFIMEDQFPLHIDEFELKMVLVSSSNYLSFFLFLYNLFILEFLAPVICEEEKTNHSRLPP